MCLQFDTNHKDTRTLKRALPPQTLIPNETILSGLQSPVAGRIQQCGYQRRLLLTYSATQHARELMAVGLHLGFKALGGYIGFRVQGGVRSLSSFEDLHDQASKTP